MHKLYKFRFISRLRLVAAILVPLTAVLFSSGIAEAHVLKEDNGFSAVLHIDPDDEPVANQVSALDFLMGNQDGTFSLSNYSLQIAIANGNGHVIKRAPVPPETFGDATTATLNYTFPKTDVYDLILTGSSTTTHKQAFQMTYLVRVATSAATASTSATTSKGAGNEVLILSAGSLAIVAMVGYSNITSGRRYAARSNMPIKSKSSRKAKKLTAI